MGLDLSTHDSLALRHEGRPSACRVFYPDILVEDSHP